MTADERVPSQDNCSMSTPSPRVSVLMTTYNGAAFIRQSIDSVLGQSFWDFELIVVDDCSTDVTAEILASYDDPRLRIIRNPRNLGVVAARNLGFAAVRGVYVAALDHDDISYPKRLASQVAYLDHNERVVLVGAYGVVIDNGEVCRTERSGAATPEALRWVLHVGNPLTYSSVMFRTAAVRRLGSFMRQEYELADDFDLYHRLIRGGDIAIIPERLVVYRQHNQMLSRTRHDEMIGKTAAILRAAYADLLGHDDDTSALLVARHFGARKPVREGALLEHLASILERLISAFIARYDLNAVQRRRLVNHAASLWWDTLLASMRAGAVLAALRHRNAFRWSHEVIPQKSSVALSLISGMFPGKQQVKPLVTRGAAVLRTNSLSAQQTFFELKGVRFETLALGVDGPPCLYVVVDTEEEFDWNGPLGRALTSVHSVVAQERAQAIFDSYGLRPIYVVDYAVASQPEGYEPLREIFNRHACAIGAHLHPWITPPFDETVSEHNSYSGNLPAALEEAKLRCLVTMIQKVFGISPLFFKAGRYGIGPSTVETLARLGFAVDFSMLPGADLRLSGGADFRFIKASPCRAIAHDILSIPMTRGKIGVLAWLPHSINALPEFRLCRKWRIPGMLARAGLLNVVTLTPEGVTSEEQIRLIRSMTHGGYRVFAMHYHSPSLVPGNTPYVSTERELGEFLGRLERVCKFFFGELGGVPGNPADLVSPQMRNRIWPRSRQPESC